MKKNIYLRLWQDALGGIHKNNPKDYKWMAFIFISMGNALNILSILALLNALFKTPILLFSHFDISLFTNKSLDSLSKFFLEFMLLPITINFLYVNKNKQSLQIEIVISSSGIIFASYMIISIIMLVVSMLIAYVKLLE